MDEGILHIQLKEKQKRNYLFLLQASLAQCISDHHLYLYNNVYLTMNLNFALALYEYLHTQKSVRLYANFYRVGERGENRRMSYMKG